MKGQSSHGEATEPRFSRTFHYKQHMTERIFNLFLEIKDKMIYELGAACHDIDGDDQAKLRFLQEAVRADLERATRYPIPDRYQVIDPTTQHRASMLSYESYIKLAQRQKHLEVFAEVFQELNSPDEPLVCITPIVDGVPKIEVVERF